MQRIKYLVMDVDGTLTDGKIYIGKEGELYKAFNIKDGYGIHDILIPAGITPVIITGRSSNVLEYRCRELGITMVYQGVMDKLKKIDEILTLADSMYTYENIAYIGDDINDIIPLKTIRAYGGLTGCPSDAVKQVKAVAQFVSGRNGGNGAVRDFIEWIIFH